MSENVQLNGLCDRFRGFYPVVIDVETAGFNAKTDALLEIAAILNALLYQHKLHRGHYALTSHHATRWRPATFD